MGTRVSIFLSIGAAALASAPAYAERIRTYWRLEPVVPQAPPRVAFGELFFEQRLLPVSLVELTEPLAAGSRTLEKGTPLYLVFNDEGRIGYCTVTGSTTGGPSKLLYIPILNQRPCLVDSDGDGRFDKVFSAFQKYGGPPSARGSINGATPLPATGGYRQIDVHSFPSDLRVSFRLTGKRDAIKARIGVKFTHHLGASWPPLRGSPTSSGTLFSLPNANILLKAVEGDSASLDMVWGDDVYLSTDDHNTLIWGPLPRFVPRG